MVRWPKLFRWFKQRPAPGVDLLIGQAIGSYVISEKLSSGGMGAVYLATHQRLEKTKVVKVLLAEYKDDPEVRARFEREAQAVARLHHDRIISVDDLAVLPDGQLYQLMERLEGRPLDNFLRSRGGLVGKHRALEIIAQVADALEYLHSMGVVHRDLKPANLFIHDRAIKLLDFGIAKANIDGGAAATKSGVAIGTPLYMSPEQFTNANKASYLSDLYSLAILAWELVTGDLPFRADNVWVLLHLQQTVVPFPPPQSSMPREWLPILQKQLRPEPSTRFQSAREFVMELAKATPAEGKKLSGEEIVWKYASRLLERADPGADTARSAAEAERMWALMPPRSEHAPPLPPRDVVIPTRGPGTIYSLAADQVPAPVPPVATAATSLERPRNASTFSSAVGSRSQRSGGRWWLVVAALSTTALAALVTMAISTWSGSPSRTTPAAGSEESPSATAVTRSPKTPPIPEAELAAKVGSGSSNTVASASREQEIAAIRTTETSAAPDAAVTVTAPKPSTPEVAPVVSSGSGSAAAVAPARPRPITPTTPRGEGEIFVAIKPGSATIMINGKYLGDTPYRGRIAAGTYTLRLENDDLKKTKTIRVKINPDALTEIVREW